jgi:hypothetical protein
VTAVLTLTAPITAALGHPCTCGGVSSTASGDAASTGAPAPVAEIDGQPITAAHLRRVLEALDATCPGGLQAPAGGVLQLALTDPVSGRLRAVVTRAHLEALVRTGCPAHRNDDCDCPVLDSPTAVDRYRPSAAQQRFVRTRDRTCRFPGCALEAAWADLDHVVPHTAGGETACENLCCLCRRHHRLKTHARGWSFVLTDGALTITTPAGIPHVTWPPGQAPPPDTTAAPF